MVSTPQCRDARARRRAIRCVDHVMTYFFAEGRVEGVQRTFGGAGRRRTQAAAVARRRARGVRRAGEDRRAPRQSRGRRTAVVARPRGVPAVGNRRAGADRLVDVDGVGGVWSAASRSVEASLASARAGQYLSYCFLDDDPVVAAQRCGRCWSGAGVTDRRTVVRRAVLPRRAARMGSLCAVSEVCRADRLDGGLRQGAPSRGAADRAARRRKGRRGGRFRLVLDPPGTRLPRRDDGRRAARSGHRAASRSAPPSCPSRPGTR